MTANRQFLRTIFATIPVVLGVNQGENVSSNLRFGIAAGYSTRLYPSAGQTRKIGYDQDTGKQNVFALS